MRILVVEDDAKLARALERGLRLEGYDVATAGTGEQALVMGEAEHHAAIVLDLGLPGLDGFEVCRVLRQREQWTPVLMLTARSDVADRIHGLDLGADDYLVKPFDFGELLARLRVLVRRGPSRHAEVLTVGDLRVDASTRVVSRAGRQVELTAREYDVLEVLARHAGRLVPRSMLLEAVWGGDQPVSPNVTDVYIGYLRRKLERPGGRPLIRTVRGRGFLLQAP